MRAQCGVDEESWCPEPKRIPASKAAIPNSKKKRTVCRNSKDEQSFTEVVRGYFYSEEREPTEDESEREEEPDKIETHRMMMEDQKRTPEELVTQSYYACEVKSEERVKRSMVKLANHTLDENEIVKRYLGPGTGTNNSAMLFLAGTLFSANRSLFVFLHENGLFRPSSQNAVNAVASDFITQSQKLSNALLRAERSSGAAVKNMVVSCVNNFVSTSDRLSKALEQDIAMKSAAIGSAKENVLNNIITTRNRISDSLYGSFQRTVQVEKVTPVANVSKEIEDTARVLADAEKYSDFLYSGLDKEKIAEGSGIEAKAKRGKNANKDPKVNLRKNALFQPDERDDSISGDASDMLSTASSFLDFINSSSLSVMFEEDERDSRDSGVPEAHLDTIFERMNLSVPKERVEDDTASTSALPGAEWGYIDTKVPKLTAREKRRLMMMERSQARQARKQKNLERKKARAKEQSENKDIWSKMSIIGRKSKKNQDKRQGKNGRVMVEV